MKLAVISDVHANLEALEACLKKIEELKTDRIICLGDLVDYCAQPNECVELVKKYSDIVVMGNHDEAQFHYDLVSGFGENAMISSVHTRSVIRHEYVGYFRTLPFTHTEDNMFFVHGSPYEPQSYHYVLTEGRARMNFSFFEGKVCFIGHSHIPVVFREKDGDVEIVEPGNVKDDGRYIINVGSIGQPRDGDPRTGFGLFDTESFKYQNVRVGYPAGTTSKKILEEGLPEYLAERILKGI